MFTVRYIAHQEQSHWIMNRDARSMKILDYLRVRIHAPLESHKKGGEERVFRIEQLNRNAGHRERERERDGEKQRRNNKIIKTYQ